MGDKIEQVEIPVDDEDLTALAMSLTQGEIDAMSEEMAYLEPYAGSDDVFHAAALRGRCFCAGRFLCTRCKFKAERMGAQ